MSLPAPNKKMKLDGDLILLFNKHIDDLPPENLGQILRSGLSVIDLLNCEGVSRHWKWAVGEFGWSELKKLDRRIVFERATQSQKDRFTAEHLISLLRLIGGSKNNLMDLDLHSFGHELIRPFVPQIAESIQLFTKLVKLNIQGFNLAAFVNFLPVGLRQLITWNRISFQTLEKLSEKCPNLEEVPFTCLAGINVPITENAALNGGQQSVGSLTAIATLKKLEVLYLAHFDNFDETVFEAIFSGCVGLRYFCFTHAYQKLTEATLFHLAALPNLTVLSLFNYLDLGPRTFTDSVLKAIAENGKLKKLVVAFSELTDDSIVFLIERCKSLVSLSICNAEKITKRTLEAVIAEVHRRHGNPPRLLPNGPRDKEIFYFYVGKTGIDKSEANKMAKGIPWLTLGFCFDSDPRDFD